MDKIELKTPKPIFDKNNPDTMLHCGVIKLNEQEQLDLLYECATKINEIIEFLNETNNKVFKEKTR